MKKDKSGIKRMQLIHLTRRTQLPGYVSWIIRICAIVVAFVVCAIITGVMTGITPFDFFNTIIKGAFGTERKWWILGQELSILLVVSLALTPAFRMKFWNLGGEGQVLIGGLVTAACMILLGDKVPNAVLIPIMTIGAMAGGAVWAGIPAFFKAKWNTNETLFTLMMNYVAVQLVAFFVIVWEVPKGSGKIGVINQDTGAGWLPELFGEKYLLNIIVVAIITVGMYIYLKYSKHGYEIAVVGESTNTARYVGIKVGKVIFRTLLISGAICGLAGLLLVGGTDHTVTTTIAGGRGFIAVMVTWLAKFNPINMILSSFLLVFLSRGASEISTEFGLNHSFGDILTGIILFFVIGSEFFINYKINVHKKS